MVGWIHLKLRDNAGTGWRNCATKIAHKHELGKAREQPVKKEEKMTSSFVQNFVFCRRKHYKRSSSDTQCVTVLCIEDTWKRIHYLCKFQTRHKLCKCYVTEAGAMTMKAGVLACCFVTPVFVASSSSDVTRSVSVARLNTPGRAKLALSCTLAPSCGGRVNSLSCWPDQINEPTWWDSVTSALAVSACSAAQSADLKQKRCFYQPIRRCFDLVTYRSLWPVSTITVSFESVVLKHCSWTGTTHNLSAGSHVKLQSH